MSMSPSSDDVTLVAVGGNESGCKDSTGLALRLTARFGGVSVPEAIEIDSGGSRGQSFVFLGGTRLQAPGLLENLAFR